jgi:drug/metabolite transporter (DMT)-like permease
MPNLRVYLLPVGIIQLGFGLLILYLFPMPDGVSATPILVAIGSGFTRSLGLLLMLQAMRSQEVSRIIPVVNTFPIFVAILAVPLLGESLGYLKWLSILMTVAGAILISIRRNIEGQGASLHKSFTMLLGCSLFLGVANTASKYAMDYISFWNMYSISVICFCIVFLSLSVRPRILRELMDMKGRGLALALIIVNECIVMAGIILSFWAMERGPVSLVSTILGVRPFFVFIYALALSRIFPAVLNERISRSIATIKIISIGLIIGGVTLLTLDS